MGIGSDTIDQLIWLRTKNLLQERTAVVEIGAQQLNNSFLSAPDKIKQLGTLFGINRPLSLPPPKPTHIVHGQLEHLDVAAPWARDFWNWLGFEYAAIDIDGSPGSIPLDLNVDSVPPEARSKYQLVTNFGTTEHVANQVNAFKIIHELTALDGLMIHAVPAQGFFNHGLVNYNFKFFWMLGRSNGYRFIHANFGTATTASSLPQDILGFLQPWGANGGGKLHEEYRAFDAGIGVIMQKRYDIPFVPPIDVATGTETSNVALKQRYWTVFEPGVFERLERERDAT